MAPSLLRHTRGNQGISWSGWEGRRRGRRRRRSTALGALPVVLLTVIVGKGPPTRIRDAVEHGQHKPTPQGGHAPEHQEGWEGKTARPADRTTRVMSGKPASGPSNATLRVFVCNFCSTAEMVPWCGQNPDCGHPECTEALARCAAPHQLDDRRFHGQVNMAIIERQLWERYEEVMAEEAS